jgi:NAD(P)-dependent dehydrogenase (short-subunit alcohol dehydrogenase family)
MIKLITTGKIKPSIMSNNFENKVIAVTGGASGIGRATCKLLSSRGAILSIADIQASALESLSTEIEAAGGKVLTTVVDVSSRPQIEAWFVILLSLLALSRLNLHHSSLTGLFWRFNLVGTIGSMRSNTDY